MRGYLTPPVQDAAIPTGRLEEKEKRKREEKKKKKKKKEKKNTKH
ncbi:hypothetical protein GQ607_005877 [Colletotrichum asianum]|uniref:Uncharacterized protein n=1 Tax=Colletotrichum asianum TaxID=702518 RepID=A0A8H3WGV4_9PEZI|nr:hypothetical protein GQ607_005877 [Colletotrichum asianum]